MNYFFSRISQTVFSILFFASCASDIPVQRLTPELDLQGHRGARGLKPENTIPAFEEALKWEMKTLELDTVLTKDKQLIVHHDTELNPVICKNPDGTSVKREPISNFTVEELKQLDCGSLQNPAFPEQKIVPGTKLSTLQEFFQFIKDHEKKNKNSKKVFFNIETKFPPKYDSVYIEEFASIMVAEIEKAGMVDRSTVQSFTIEVLPFVKRKNPKLQTSALFAPTIFQGIRVYLGIGTGLKNEIIEKAENVKADIISPYFIYVDKEFVAKAHSKNIKVIPWTVNETKEMERLKRCGVDGMISDYPDRLKKVL